jgi:predicted DCC family thiol-disulfide oxidoreductase YuxK
VILDDEPAFHPAGRTDGLRVKSDAALAILAGLGHGWQLVQVLRIIPRPLRDLVYDLIARYRYRWFGKREECRIPTPEERDRFLP